MNRNKARKLFTKYINNECSPEELQLLNTYLESFQGKNRVWPEKRVGSEEEFIKKSWLKIEAQINKEDKEKRYPFSRFIKYAAAASVFLIVTLALFPNKHKDAQIVEPNIVKTDVIVPGSEKATLTLGDGSVVVLEKGNGYKTQNLSSNGEEIVYKGVKKKSTEIVYNFLTIPRGGQFYLVLSDGTEVWLNSESQLKYPVAFVESETRKVELVYGEAFFAVSPSTEHKGSKFIVLNANQEVEVLGTEFNIKAYKDENIVYTTLVEGKVIVSNSFSKQNLVPNQQSIVSVKNKEITIQKIDAYSETSWRKGLFSFKSKTLKEIMMVLSRWYDLNVVFENPKLESVKFNGVLSKDDSIEDILRKINSTNFITAYEIKDKKITLK